ncbi:MAG: hypothetical protein KKD01_14360 [Proteobacteria bacterium]|nr:hypothetical protein [Pseudomonadota bacterium]MBU1138874.1 hypothetical protein [Pseudomonadota bacterium]MBU1231864.1 hypothetical protein [Pseudomonadota bacterium]MBU1419756.1 hypothetical protein [Pseudomonadota bacterium]MBU1455904.1 hypothetical protein [Pseudomonadota bacterium]
MSKDSLAVIPERQLSLEDVPVDGALGLLAYGDIGLQVWRDKRTELEGDDWREKLARELSAQAEAVVQKESDGTD